MANLTTAEFLDTLVYTDAQSTNSASVGTFQEIFNNFTARINVSKNYREDGSLKSCSVMLTNKTTGKVSWVTCSDALSPFVRNGSIELAHIAGFPVFRGDNGGNYVGFPAPPNEDVANLVVRKYTATAISLDETIG